MTFKEYLIKGETMYQFTYNLSFKIGDKVRYKNRVTGKDEGYITVISIRQNGICYGVTWSDRQEVYHYDFELELIPE